MADKSFETRVTDKTKNLTTDDLILKDPADTQRQMKITLPSDIPSNGVPQTKVMIVRENIADYVNMSAVETANFTATWGSGYRVDATSGNIRVLIPAAATANADRFIQIHRIDISVNTVTVVSENTAQAFFQLLGNTDGNAFTIRAGGTVNIRSIGTVPVVTNYHGVNVVSRLWLPDDASTDPNVWYNFRNTGSLTLSGTEITNINNLGTSGASFNLIRNGVTGPTRVNSQYADFAGGARAMRTSASQAAFAGANFSAGISYQLTAAEASTHFTHQLTSRLSWHVKWSDNNSYIDLPISSRISANLGSTVIGANPHIAIGRKGTNREFFIDGNTTAAISAAGGGNALAGSGFFGIGGTITNTPGAIDLYTGRMYEAVFYSIELTNDERDRLAAYLMWQIGQQGLLDATNPYRITPPLVTQRTF